MAEEITLEELRGALAEQFKVQSTSYVSSSDKENQAKKSEGMARLAAVILDIDKEIESRASKIKRVTKKSLAG